MGFCFPDRCFQALMCRSLHLNLNNIKWTPCFSITMLFISFFTFKPREPEMSKVCTRCLFYCIVMNWRENCGLMQLHKALRLLLQSVGLLSKTECSHYTQLLTCFCLFCSRLPVTQISIYCASIKHSNYLQAVYQIQAAYFPSYRNTPSHATLFIEMKTASWIAFLDYRKQSRFKGGV